MRFRDEDIEKLNNNLNILNVVEKFVDLKKSGANYKGLCPFHPDTKPSFYVNVEKNICKCFVCGAGGSPIKFYANYKKIPFGEAVKELAQEYHVPIKPIYGDLVESAENSRYYKIMESALDFYMKQIFENSGRDALEYLTKRGVNPENIKKYNLGFAPDSRKTLTEFLLKEGYLLEELVLLGLAKENERGVYDSFRNRVMFPIYSTSKKIIAFGGRTLEQGDNIPKYINSPDTPIFKKGNILYGLGERGNSIRSKNYAIVMEGYMDVLMTSINDFDTAIAPLGTALTEEQGKLLKNYCSNVILAFDADGPGQSATEKTILILKKIGFDIKVLKIEGAKDPDEYIKKFGRDGFLNVIKNSLECFDFLIEYYKKDYDLNNDLAKGKFIERFHEFFSLIGENVQKSLYINKLSDITGIDRETLKNQFTNSGNRNIITTQNSFSQNFKKSNHFEKNKNYISNEIVTDEYSGEKVDEGKIRLEEKTVALFLFDNEYFKYFNELEYSDKICNKIVRYFNEYLQSNKVIDFGQLMKSEYFSEEEREKMLGFISDNHIYSKDKNSTESEFLNIFHDWLVTKIKKTKENLELLEIDKKIKYRTLINRIDDLMKKPGNSLEQYLNIEKQLKNAVNEIY